MVRLLIRYFVGHIHNSVSNINQTVKAIQRQHQYQHQQQHIHIQAKSIFEEGRKESGRERGGKDDGGGCDDNDDIIHFWMNWEGRGLGSDINTYNTHISIRRIDHFQYIHNCVHT